VALAAGARLLWVLAVPTVPVSDFAMYRESANYLSEFGRLDHGFIYMPGFVALLAWIKDLGGDLLAQKMPGVVLGGLGAAGLFGLTLGLFEHLSVAVVATLLYALWPAGVAMSSVVGTDMPAAALLALALGALALLGPRRPWVAALVFGVLMGLGAWVRAVLLPLSALSLGYWLARRTRWPAALALTLASVAATLLVLLPWGLRQKRESGHLYFTDDHGGVTALIGANPNSEGSYTRAMNSMFQEVTGHSVLDEPHHDVDTAAYAMARDWTRFSPRYALGLIAKKAERLFEPERRLLYWSILRPGVLPGASAAWFDRRREPIGAAADAFGVAVALLALVGFVITLVRGRWPALAVVPFMLALAATYTLFFAEPRYRLPIELLAFPFVAVTLVELGKLAAGLARRSWPDVRVAGYALAASCALAVPAATWAWPASLEAGAALRARHRWGWTVFHADESARVAKWRVARTDAPVSPIEAGAGGTRLSLEAGKPTEAVVELGVFEPGTYELALEATTPRETTLALRTEAGAPVADLSAKPGEPLKALTVLAHPGGELRLVATATSTEATTLVVTSLALTKER
jgi:hypothetical protein